jgi:hypothetical protein
LNYINFNPISEVPKLRQIAFVYELFAKEIRVQPLEEEEGRRRRIKNSYLNFSIPITNEFTI